MKLKLFLCLIFSAQIGLSQTKKETTDWVKHYLNQYTTRYFSYTPLGQKFQNYTYEYQTIDFDSTFLIYDAIQHRRTEEKDSLIKREVARVDLSKVKKIDIEYDSVGYNIHFRINFHFYEWEDYNYKGYSVVKYLLDDQMNRKYLNEGYYTGYWIDLIVKDMRQENLIERMKKALIHLCSVNGAKIMKEVF